MLLGPIPHRTVPYEEFFAWGRCHHCPIEVDTYNEYLSNVNSLGVQYRPTCQVLNNHQKLQEIDTYYACINVLITKQYVTRARVFDQGISNLNTAV